MIKQSKKKKKKQLKSVKQTILHDYQFGQTTTHGIVFEYIIFKLVNLSKFRQISMKKNWTNKTYHHKKLKKHYVQVFAL
jgi:hypothetical protein